MALTGQGFVDAAAPLPFRALARGLGAPAGVLAGERDVAGAALGVLLALPLRFEEARGVGMDMLRKS